MFIDLHLFARSGVACHTAFTSLDLETAEPANLNVFPLFQRTNDGLDETIDNRFGFDFRQSRCRSNHINNVGFRQSESPKVVSKCTDTAEWAD